MHINPKIRDETWTCYPVPSPCHHTPPDLLTVALKMSNSPHCDSCTIPIILRISFPTWPLNNKSNTSPSTYKKSNSMTMLEEKVAMLKLCLSPKW